MAGTIQNKAWPAHSKLGQTSMGKLNFENLSFRFDGHNKDWTESCRLKKACGFPGSWYRSCPYLPCSVQLA